MSRNKDNWQNNILDNLKKLLYYKILKFIKFTIGRLIKQLV